MQSTNNKVLVTGGAGYIGSHACKALAAAGYEPVTFDNLVNGHREAVKWGPIVVGDLTNLRDIEVALETYQPSAVLHMGGSISVRESVSDPGDHYRNNIVGAYNLLEAMRRFDVDRIVFSSSCTVYGYPQFLPLTEEHPRAPFSPYGRTKFMVEEILEDYAAAYGLRSVVLRFFNAAGADPDLETGEARPAETHLIPCALQAALGVRPELLVFGDDYDTRDGTCVRDYVHVTDIAAANLQALDYLDRGDAGSQGFNLSSGSGYTVREIIDATRRISGQEFPVQVRDRRPGDPPVLVGDATRAHKVLGWTPQHSDLDTIVATAWYWKQACLARERASETASE